MNPVLIHSRATGPCWTTVSMMVPVISGSSQTGLCLTVKTPAAAASRARSARSR